MLIWNCNSIRIVVIFTSMEDDFTSYEPSVFTVIVDKLEFDSKTGFVVQSDFAALIHEW